MRTPLATGTGPPVTFRATPSNGIAIRTPSPAA
jgi:hypothetical protein